MILNLIGTSWFGKAVVRSVTGRTKSGEATTRSAHESFDARPGNHTELSTSIFL